MRSASILWAWLPVTFLGVLTGLAGCQEMPLPGGFTAWPQNQPQAPQPQVQAEPADDLAASAQSHAQRVAAAAPPSQTLPSPEIHWLNTSDPQQVSPVSPVARQAPPPPAKTVVTPPQPQAVSGAQDPYTPQITPVSLASAPVAVSQADTQLTQAQVYEQLLQAVRSGDDSDLSKALTAATLGAVGPHGRLDQPLLASLSPKNQDLVRRYHQAVTALRQEVLQGGGRIDQAQVTSRLGEVFGRQPITIRTIELCEKVLGFGVYDAFPERTFMAGREQKLIVYVELDNFLPTERTEADGYEVHLRQELELYESNGFEVWSHEPVQIVDVSRNKRRDFFVVQLVTLPAQLSVGQYHLKVRVYDENAGTRDETSINIQLVADASLVRGSSR